MATIDVLQIGEIAPQAPVGQRINVDAAQMRNRGAAAMGRAVAGVGDEMMQVAHKMRAAKDATDLVNADLEMERAQTEFQTELQTNQNQATWAKKFDAKAANVGINLLNGKEYSTAVKREIEARYSVWTQRQRTSVENQAARKGIADSLQVLKSGAMAAATAGNKVMAGNYVAQMQALGLASDADAADYLTSLRHTADVQTVNREINADPIAAVEALEDKTEGGKWRQFPDIDDNTRLALTREATVEVNRLRTQTAEDFRQRFLNEGSVPTGDIDAAVEAGTLTAIQGRSLVKFMTGKMPYAEAISLGNEVSGEISKLSPADPDFNLKVSALGEKLAGLPEGMRAKLETRILNLTEPSATASKPGETYLNELYETHALGNVGKFTAADEKPKKGIFKGGYKDLDAANKANERRLTLETAFEAFMAKNPYASPIEQKAFIDGQISNVRNILGSSAILAPTGSFK